MGSGNSRNEITNEVVTDMATNILTTSMTECFASVNIVQSIRIEADPNAGNTALGETHCLNTVKAIRDARMALEAEAEERNPHYHRATVRPELDTMMLTGLGGGAGSAMGPCDGLKSVFTTNINQTSTNQLSTQCNVTNNITNSVNNKIDGESAQLLTNQQDIFGQFGDAWSGTRNRVSTKLGTHIKQNITSKFTNSLHNKLKVNQIINITGNSIYVNGLQQQLTSRQTGSLTAINTVVNEVKNSAVYAIDQVLVNKNDTVGDLLANVFLFFDEFSKLINGLAEQGLVLAFLFIVLMGLMILLIYFSRLYMTLQVVEVTKLRQQRGEDLETPAKTAWSYDMYDTYGMYNV